METDKTFITTARSARQQALIIECVAETLSEAGLGEVLPPVAVPSLCAAAPAPPRRGRPHGAGGPR